MPEEIPAAGPGLEKSWLETPSGRVEAWYLAPKGNKKPVPGVVFAHGNAEFIDHWVDKMQAFAGLGMGVLLVEYPSRRALTTMVQIPEFQQALKLRNAALE